MKGSNVHALVLCLSVAAAGCDGDFLTTIPPDQLSDAVFWSQEKDAVLAVNAIYPMNNSVFFTIRNEGASDNGWAQKSFDAWYTLAEGTMQPTSTLPVSVWGNAYGAIRRANEVVANIDRIPQIDANLKERLKGEARFHRAYHYNLLTTLYGDVPLVLEPIDSRAGGEAVRTPREQVIAQVLQDLDFAASVLPQSYSGADRGRVTRGAALAFKARAALYSSNWQVAADAAKAVMDLGVYQLHANYHDLTRYAGENSLEIIFADQRLQTHRSHSSFSWLGPRSQGGLSDVTPIRGLVDAYQMIDGRSITESPLFDVANPYENRDPRMYSTLLYPGAVFDGEVYNSLPSSTTADQVRRDFSTTSTGFQFIKYVDPADRANPTNSGINIILMRYADVLLMYAEAKIELNQIDQTVVDVINAVRTRGGMPAIAGGLSSQSELRDIVRYERRVELAMEGQRAFDIMRWRIAHEVMPGQHWGIDYVEDGVLKTIPAQLRFFDASKNYLWPIPQPERDLNPALTQNPGY
jgi:starch-binding outer membrane protein, SusD/RagB family